MDAISWSTQSLNVLENSNTPRVNHFDSSIFALKHRDPASTHQLFDEMPQSTDSLVWNRFIQTHLGNTDYHKAVMTYHEMLARGVRPDRHTFPRILSVSRRLGSLALGKQLHGQAMKLGVCNDIYVTGGLIELYGNLDGIDAAKWVLYNSKNKMNSVSWTLLGKLYIKQNKPLMAIDLFKEMVNSGAEIDPVSVITCVTACILAKSLKDGRFVHQTARKHGLMVDLLVSNSLMKMYIECGSIEDARELFDQMSLRDAISWTSIIQGYVKNGEINEGLKLFRRMITEDEIKPDVVAISSILPACARMAAHKHGREIHGYLVKNITLINPKVENALVDMYAKSGHLEYAITVFSKMKFKDIVSWTVMIFGYSLHGHGDIAVDLFQQIPNPDIDEFCYIAALHACCTSRTVEQGTRYFNCINSPTLVHYTLMVALLSRAGKFNEASAFIDEHRISTQPEVVRALIDGCRIHKNLTLGRRLIARLCNLDALNADNYIMMSNYYAQRGKEGLGNVWRQTVTAMGLTPNVAYSWIELRNKVHVFRTGDVSHPRSEGVYAELECLMRKFEREQGFGLVKDFSFHDVDEERECGVVGHSELLAMSFGLISSASGMTVRVTKNRRVCGSCHEVVKYVSKIVSREIVLKDPNRFHHFKNGVCSCQDYY